MTMVNVAILDDYQKVALSSADWAPGGGGADVTVFTDHIADETALIRRLAPFDVIVAMRERNAFPAAVLERLPQLRLLITTGMGNASIDLQAAARLGVTVCGTGGSPAAPPELVWGLILALARYITQGG